LYKHHFFHIPKFADNVKYKLDISEYCGICVTVVKFLNTGLNMCVHMHGLTYFSFVGTVAHSSPKRLLIVAKSAKHRTLFM
jgi:hypothetical protein